MPKIERECHEFNIRQAIEKRKKKRRMEEMKAAKQKSKGQHYTYNGGQNTQFKYNNSRFQQSGAESYLQAQQKRLQASIGGYKAYGNKSAVYRPKTGYLNSQNSGSNFNKYAPAGFKTGPEAKNGSLGGLNKLNNFLKK